MYSIKSSARIVAVLILLLGGRTVATAAEPAEGKFYRAYYLEHAQGDVAGAAKLYENVVAARGVDGRIKSVAKARLAACREELASSDFARLMPPNTVAYLEISRPGDQMLKLLANLGLLADGDRPAANGGGKRIAVSPALIKEILGVRGAAVAVTGFDPFKQMPSGVLVFDPGHLEVIRGLIETGLPIAGKASEPIDGFATYEIEDKVFVTLTSRLVVVSPQRGQIEGVIRRLNGKEPESLLTSDTFGKAVETRDDSLLFFFVNAKPIMPMLNVMMAGAGAKNREFAMAQALLDLNSIQSLMGNVGVSDDGLILELALRLDEGHGNLVYNFFRTPPISWDTLKYVPPDAAAVVVGALSEASSRYSPAPSAKGEKIPVITALDFGREVFANIIGVAIYALEPENPSSGSTSRIPDIGAAISVHDVSQSEALWAQVLGIATLAGGSLSKEGQRLEIDGVEVRSYQFPDFAVYFATVDNNILISSSESAMERSIRAKQDNKSILDDDAFARSLSDLSPDSTKAVFVHAGRCAEIARRMVPPQEVACVEPFVTMLSDTVLSLVVDHSGEVFRVVARVNGIPDVGDLLAEYLEGQEALREGKDRLRHLSRSRKWDDALVQVDVLLEQQPNDIGFLRTKFRVLAVGKKDRAGAAACADLFLSNAYHDGLALNDFAWALLTEDQYAGGHNDVALKFSERSNEITHQRNWAYVDTLALARFETGDVENAVALEKKAIDLSGGKGGEVLQAALTRFEAALADAKLASVESAAPTE